MITNSDRLLHKGDVVLVDFKKMKDRSKTELDLQSLYRMTKEIFSLPQPLFAP